MMYNVNKKGYCIRDIPMDETSTSCGIDLVFVKYHERYQANNLVHQIRSKRFFGSHYKAYLKTYV